jgi:acyl carrier protein
LETLEVLKQIIVEKFEKDRDSITLDSTLETLEIDSLDIFDIVFDAEEIFGISVPNDQVTVSTIGDVVKLIDRLRAAKE